MNDAAAINPVEELERKVLGGSLEELKFENGVPLTERDSNLAGRVLAGVLVERGENVYTSGGTRIKLRRADNRTAFSVNGWSPDGLMDSAAVVGAASRNSYDPSAVDNVTAKSILGELRSSIERSIIYANPKKFTDPAILWVKAVSEEDEHYVAVSLQYRATPQDQARQQQG